MSTVSHIDIEWGPTIDAEACTGCGTCIDFCHNDVYRWNEDESRVVVAHKTHCVTGCSHCATLCEAEAISFPTLDEIKRARRGGRRSAAAGPHRAPASGATGERGPRGGDGVSTVVDFEHVSTSGLETSPVAEALAGLRANEARYFMNKYKHAFAVVPAGESRDTLDYVHRILKEERCLEIAARPLETARFEVDGIRMAYVFYESGLSVNVMYTIDDPKKRAVGFKLSEGMEVPAELEGTFKFARQRSKLAGTIRGSFFVIKGEY